MAGDRRRNEQVIKAALSSAADEDAVGSHGSDGGSSEQAVGEKAEAAGGDGICAADLVIIQSAGRGALERDRRDGVGAGSAEHDVSVDGDCGRRGDEHFAEVIIAIQKPVARGVPRLGGGSGAAAGD